MSDAVDELIERYGQDVVLAALTPVLSDERRARIEQVLAARLQSLTIVIENLYDPHNGAAAIRSCEAVGLEAMYVVEGDLPFRFSSKVATGCHKWVDVRRYPAFPACADALRARGFTIYAAVPGARESLHDIDPSAPCAFVFGNEHAGLSDQGIAACDRAFSIPMLGFTQSLNLSVSVAIAVHELAARRRAAIDAPGDLPEARKAYLRARWYALSARATEGIVARYVSESTREGVAERTPAE